MNLSALSREELLRIAEPTTDLERLLIERLSQLSDEHESCEQERIVFYGSSCGGCDEKDDEIGEMEGRIEQLKSLLDEHKIEYPK